MMSPLQKRPRLPAEIHKACTQVSRWKSLALIVLFIYPAIIALFWFGGHRFDWRYAPIAFLLIPGLQHHLLILHHEGAHVLLYPDRRANDLIADIFCAVPFLSIMKNYRVGHLAHHKFSGSPARDPEVRGYRSQGFEYRRKPPRQALRMLLEDLFLINFFRFLRGVAGDAAEAKRTGKVPVEPVRDTLLTLGFWGLLIALSVVFDLWRELLLLWFPPQMTLTFLLLKLHGYGEHTGATGPTELERTWVHEYNPIVNFFLYPIRSGLHLEHHLFPNVPWYHLGKLRRALLSDPDYRARAEKITLTGVFFGERSILRTMLVGEGEYRVDQLAAHTAELGEEVVTTDTRDEVDVQMRTLAPEGR